MLSYWGGLAAIVIMMLVSLVILFVRWDELKGAFKLMFVFIIIAFSINIESTFLNIETRQDINELEARNEALERQLKQIDPLPNKGFPVSQKEPLSEIGSENKTILKEYFRERGFTDQEAARVINQMLPVRKETERVEN